MRLVALAGLLICSLAATLRAANDADRFLETAKELIQAINSDDSAAIQASFDAQMQQVLPPDKATPFFRGLVAAKGKLKEAGTPDVTGPTAIVRVSAERGAWDFKITLEPSGKIAGLLITRAAAKAPAPASAQRFTKVANKLIQAINRDDSAAIQASFDAQMQQALPPDKATPFFRGLVTAKGKLKKAGTPQVTGPTAIVRVTAERGAWDFKISLEPSDKIAELLITEAAAEAPAAAPVSAQRFTKVTNKLFHAINTDDSAAIQASFDAQMQQALPPDKATPFFREIVSTTGKLKKAGAPQDHRFHRHRASDGRARSVGFQNHPRCVRQDFRTIRDPCRFRSGGRLDGRPAQPHPHAASVSRRVVRLLGRRQRKGQPPRLRAWPAPRRRSHYQRCRRPLSQRYRSPQRRLLCLREGNPGRSPRHRRHRDRRRPR